MAVSCNDVCPCCESCKGCFQKIVDLKNVGIVIYRHISRIDELNKTTGFLESSTNTTDDIFIIHNKKDAQIKGDECVSEKDQGIHCPRCRELVQRAMKYLKNVSPLQKKDIISVCEHCQNKKEKKKNLNNCYKCHEILKKYNFEQFKQTGTGQIRKWISNVHELLYNIVNDKRINKSLKRRSCSDIYLNIIPKDSRKPRSLEVGPIFEKGVRISKSVCSLDKYTTKSDYTIKISDTEYKKSKSVSLRTETFVPIEKNISPSETTYETIVDITGEARMPTTSQRSKGILQRDSDYTPESKAKSGRTPQTIRKYYSEEDLFFSAAGLNYHDENKPFSYIFPKELSDDILPLRRVKTSTELLIDTQKMLSALHDKIKEKFERSSQRVKSVRSVERKEDSGKEKGIDVNIRKEKKKSSATLKTTSESPGKLLSAKGKSITKKEKSETNKIQIVQKEQKEVTDRDKENKKLRQEEETDNKVYKQKEKEERQKVKPSRLLKKSEGNQVEKQEQSRKEKEVKQTSKTHEVTSKPNQTKSELPKLRIQQDEEYNQLKIEAGKKFKEEGHHVLKSIKDVNNEKKSEKEKEVKQKVITQQTVKEEKVLNKDERDKKSGKIQKVEEEGFGNLKKMLEEQNKEQNDFLKLKKQQDEELHKLKIEAEKKSKEDPPGKLKSHKEAYVEKDSKEENSKGDKKQEEQSHKGTSTKPVKIKQADDLILQLIKLRQLSKRDGAVPPLSEMDISPLMINKLNIQRAKKKLCYALYMDSDLELDLDTIKNAQLKTEKTDIIVGNKICKIKQPVNERNQTEEVVPVLYKSIFNEETTPAHLQNIPKVKDYKLISKNVEQETPKGLIRYALSDRSFIDKGWTMLPTEKVVRKVVVWFNYIFKHSDKILLTPLMNVYRMRPAHPEFDWFDRNKNKRLMLYDSGEKFAEFDDNGRGRWFYRNGRLALDYYDAEEMNAQQRFVIYGSGELDERGRYQPIAILATFDYLGNGVVFDHAGKIRLKYNQTEGIVLDRSIGPVSHWKWHTLNDPPVLQQVMIDTQMAHKDPEIMKLGGPADDSSRPDNEEMLAIEFDNFIKEKSKKLSQKFKPFQIRTKALKINENFSLRVLDQANVYIIYRDGTTNIKMNIGMILDHQEIVDTDTAEVGEVSNNLERFPARTDSLAGLQRSVAHAQRMERLRVERDRRLRHPEPCSSADKLISATSRPIKPKLHTLPSNSSLPKDACSCKCRKPSTRNVYYDTRFV